VEVSVVVVVCERFEGWTKSRSDALHKEGHFVEGGATGLWAVFTVNLKRGRESSGCRSPRKLKRLERV